MSELRRHEDRVTPGSERFPDEGLARAVAVDVGRVEERDPFVERGVDDGVAFPAIDTAPEVVAAEPHDRDLGPLAAEPPLPHGAKLPSSSRRSDARARARL
jgi:hypothetical protein